MGEGQGPRGISQASRQIVGWLPREQRGGGNAEPQHEQAAAMVAEGSGPRPSSDMERAALPARASGCGQDRRPGTPGGAQGEVLTLARDGMDDRPGSEGQLVP